ncbi:very short patch repair endonuclease [Hoeflea marina]|uniref:very short patch repair endonuclease n=1 Tax=Hoeflea marina TaxID=274592 RepID=UPI000D719227|nr:DNA mismatch endonuclease Vsr [Hoeflea marina]
MADTVSPKVRSRMMSGIRGKDTKPEMIVRRGLHALGFRFRLHDKHLPGKPDIVFPKFRAVIFVHGCFWHGHHCHLFKWPSTRTEFWLSKINRNQEVDARSESLLEKDKWRQCIVWECAVKGRAKLPLEELIAECARWLETDVVKLEIQGRDT